MAREGRALRNDPVGHFSEGACLQGRHRAGSIRQWADKWSMEHGAGSMGHGARGIRLRADKWGMP
jgi:hypothetical protein